MDIMAQSETKLKSDDPKGCWNCAQDPIGTLKQLFVDIVQVNRIKQGQDPARRPVFLKPHGVAHGRLEIRKDLPSELKVGDLALLAPCRWRIEPKPVPFPRQKLLI
jgi:hypothetical protein